MTRFVGLLAIAVVLQAAPSAQAAAPTITYSCSPAPAECSEWHRADVTLEFTVSGSGLAGVEGCETRQITTDTAGSSYKCTAWTSSTPPESTSVTAVVRRDATPPSATAAPNRAPDSGEWFNHAFAVAFNATDVTSGAASCSPTASYGGPDTASGVLTGTCIDAAGNTSAPAAFSFRYDATPPEVTGASLSRPPDSNGWYTKPVTVSFAGADGTSGIESCTSVEYVGPDGAASVPGSCRDRAGNVSQQRGASVNYDATPPALDSAAAERGSGFVVVRWQASPDTTVVEVDRLPGIKGRPQTRVYRGKASSFRDVKLARNKRYRYVVTALDQAGNRASRTLTVFMPPALYRPAPGARVKSPPLLKWDRNGKASYYNVQLFRGRQKILSKWPAKPQLKLTRAWTYAGVAQRLRPGRYTWHVWPGRGPRAKAKYGKLIGSSVFVVTR